MVYLVDSAGARITEQVRMFPGRRGAGRIFHNEVRLSGAGAAGLPAVRALGRRRRLHPRLLRRRDHARRQRLDVPRLAANGRDGDRREGHARGDGRGADAHRASRAAATSSSRPTRRRSTSRRRYLSYMPANWREGRRPRRRPRPARERPISRDRPRRREELVRRQGADRRRSSTPTRSSRSRRGGPRSSSSGTRGSTAARSGSSPTSPSIKGGVLFVDSADKAARFIWTCNAFNVPLLFLADVPGLHDRHRRSSARGSSATARR